MLMRIAGRAVNTAVLVVVSALLVLGHSPAFSQGADLIREANKIFAPLPAAMPAPPDNPTTEAKVRLGNELSDKEVNLIEAFMHSLGGQIPDEDLKLPVLPASTLATPKPVFK